MAGNTKYPPEFNPEIPRRHETPHGLFFNYVRKFLEDGRRSWNPTDRRNALRFNEGLSKAIHKDIDIHSNRFYGFQLRLKTVEGAFESLTKAHFFFDDFEGFVNFCLGRNFEYPDFQKYVRSLTQWINSYVELKTRTYSIFPDSQDWPVPKVTNDLIIHPDVMNVPKMIVVQIDTSGPPSRTMAIKASKNLKQAVNLYRELITKFIDPQFSAIVKWMSLTGCLRPILLEFEQLQEEFTHDILERETQHNTDLGHLEDMIRTETYSGPGVVDLRMLAIRSKKGLETALRDHSEAVANQHRILVAVILKVYNHALGVLKPFRYYARTWHERTLELNLRVEGDKACKSSRKWINVLEYQMSILLKDARGLPLVLADLPLLYPNIAHFSFQYFW